MSKLSSTKKEKIIADILALLYENNLKPIYTKEIANSIARDKEFTLSILKSLEKQEVIKQTKGATKQKTRRKWLITEKAYKAYKSLIPPTTQQQSFDNQPTATNKQPT